MTGTRHIRLRWAGIMASVLAFTFMLAPWGGMCPTVAAPLHGNLLDLLGPADPAIEAAKKPVTWSSNTLTATEVTKQAKEFRQRQWIDGYRLRGDHTQSSDREVARFLDTWLAEQYGGNLGTNPPDLAVWADKLAADPSCTDPLVQTLVGLLTRGQTKQIERLDLAIRSYQHSKHLAYPEFDATVVLAGQLNSTSPRIHELDLKSLALFQKCFADGSFKQQDQPLITEIMWTGWAHAFWGRNRDAITQAAHAAGTNFEWLALVLEGNDHMDAAWKARGGGFANSVTPDGWKVFGNEMDQARRCLTRAWTLHPEYAAPASMMINVANGTSDATEMRRWFDRAVDDQIDFDGAWRSMANGLMQRWHGEADSLLTFGVTAANTKRFDTDVPRKLFDIVEDWRWDQETPFGVYPFGRADVWPAVEMIYTGYIGARTGEARDGWRSAYAVVAYLAGKYDVSRAQLEALNWHPSPNNLTGWDRELSLLPVEVAARTGSSRSQVEEAESARADSDYSRASKIYATILAAVDTDDRTRQYIRCRVASLEVEQKLATGAWVDFLPHSVDDPNWVCSMGTARVTNGFFEVQSSGDGYLFYARPIIGRDFEVKADFEVVDDTGGDFNTGLIFGQPTTSGRADTPHWYAFRIRRSQAGGNFASVSLGWSKAESRWQPSVHRGRNTFDFVLHGDSFSNTVNSIHLGAPAVPTRTNTVPASSFLLGIGAPDPNTNTIVRYRSLQLRRLDKPGK